MEVAARGHGSSHWGEAISLRQIRRAISGGLTALLALCALLLLSRRVAGALAEPPSIPALLMTALIAGAGAVGVGATWPRDDEKSARVAVVVAALAAVSLLAIGIAMSVPGASPFGVVLMWLVTVGAEAALLWQFRRRGDRMGQANVRGRSSRAWRLAESIEDEPHADWQQSTQTQRLNYRRDDAGRLAIDGWIRVDFLPEQRTAIVHVAFCPAFEDRPKLEAEPLDGPACEVRPTLVLPWGVRWEVRLDAPAAAPTAVVLGFSAVENELRDKSHAPQNQHRMPTAG